MLVEWMERHKLITFMVLLWAMFMVSWATWIIFTKPPVISAGTASAYATLLGLPAAAIGLYKWRREKK